MTFLRCASLAIKLRHQKSLLNKNMRNIDLFLPPVQSNYLAQHRLRGLIIKPSTYHLHNQPPPSSKFVYSLSKVILLLSVVALQHFPHYKSVCDWNLTFQMSFFFLPFAASSSSQSYCAVSSVILGFLLDSCEAYRLLLYTCSSPCGCCWVYLSIYLSLRVYRNRRGVWNLSSRSNRVHPFHLSAKNIDSQCLRAIVYSCNVRSFINIKIIDIIDGTG